MGQRVGLSGGLGGAGGGTAAKPPPHLSAGCGTLCATLAAIARRGRIVAFDIAELNPPADSSGATARLTTRLITHLLSELFG